jgi:hypothetical protein
MRETLAIQKIQNVAQKILRILELRGNTCFQAGSVAKQAMSTLEITQFSHITVYRSTRSALSSYSSFSVCLFSAVRSNPSTCCCRLKRRMSTKRYQLKRMVSRLLPRHYLKTQEKRLWGSLVDYRSRQTRESLQYFSAVVILE